MVSESLSERINAKRLQEFARSYGLQVSGIKQDLIDRIMQAVADPHHKLTEEALNDFIADEISHGRNRMLFISEMPEQVAKQLNDEGYVRDCLLNYNYPFQDFNDLRSSDVQESIKLVYLLVTKQGDIVTRIALCFARSMDIEVETQDEEGEVVLTQKQIIDYYWVDLKIMDCRIIIKLRSRGGFSEYNNINELRSEIYNLIAEVFSIAPVTMHYTTNTIYKIYKELTVAAELPFREAVATLAEKIRSFSEECSAEIGIQNHEGSINLPHRISRLFERALIHGDFLRYQAYADNKIGIISRIAFSDETGARVNARSGDADGIEMADIYFDTRDTIDLLQNVERIWVNWFIDRDTKVETKLEGTPKYYLVHFTRGYTTKEVEDHVLSQIKHFEGLPL